MQNFSNLFDYQHEANVWNIHHPLTEQLEPKYNKIHQNWEWLQDSFQKVIQSFTAPAKLLLQLSKHSEAKEMHG